MHIKLYSFELSKLHLNSIGLNKGFQKGGNIANFERF